VLLRLAYLGVTNTFAMLRLLPMSDRDKDIEILALRHQLSVLERQLSKRKVRFSPSDRVFLAALLHRLPLNVLRRLRLLVQPDTVLLAPRPGRTPPRCRVTPETTGTAAYRAVHPRSYPAPGTGEPQLGLPPHPRRTTGPRRESSRLHRLGDPAGRRDRPVTRTELEYLGGLPALPGRGPAGLRLLETVSLSGARLFVFAVIEHGSRRIRILGATAHPSSAWVVQAAKNLVMDLEDTGCRARFLIRDRDCKFSDLFDTVLRDAGIEVVLSGVQMPRMNSIMERWVQTCRRELLDRTLIWNQRHLIHALREFEHFYNGHRPHQGIANARPLYPLPTPSTDPHGKTRLDIRRRDRLGGTLHEYQHAA
jgi:putative transposase